MAITTLDGTTVRPARRLGRRGLVVLLLAISVASVGAGAVSLAVFTSQANVGANAFTTGSIALTTSPTTALLTNSAMMPGDTGIAPLVLTAGSGGALRYAISGSSTNADTKALMSQLLWTIKTKTANPCSTFDGTTLYGPTAINSIAVIALVGSAAQGSQAGDRALAASGTETLCFKYDLPLTTGNAYQSASTTTTFQFDSEQTANNP